MLSETLQREFQIIDAQHTERRFMRNEIYLLRLLLKEASGEKLSLHDVWTIRDIVKAVPHLGEVYDTQLRKYLEVNRVE